MADYFRTVTLYRLKKENRVIKERLETEMLPWLYALLVHSVVWSWMSGMGIVGSVFGLIAIPLLVVVGLYIWKINKLIV